VRGECLNKKNSIVSGVISLGAVNSGFTRGVDSLRLKRLELASGELVLSQRKAGG
jgi:hypothetical protein